MRPKLSHILLAGACLTLAACATSSPYQAARNNYSYGYSDQRIEADRYRVSFSGNSLTSVQQVENYLLYRAAELTLQQGYDYFVITNRETQSKDRFVDDSLPTPYRPYGFGWTYYSPFYGGWATGFGRDPFFDRDLELRKITKYSATAEIVMALGKKPANDDHAYDAREVVQNLGNTIERPQ